MVSQCPNNSSCDDAQTDLSLRRATCQVVFSLYYNSNHEALSHKLGAQWLSGRVLDSRPRNSTEQENYPAHELC